MAGLGVIAALALVPPPPRAGAAEEVAVFSGGCFWGIEAVFEHVKGVTHAESGYAGGVAATANYEAVSTGDTGHAESVRVTFDPSQVSYGQLLQVFFSVAHDPTELNYQGPDHGPQYRSVIWYTSEAQRRTAEAYHQDYATRHPDAPYIVYNDAPKVERLKKDLPALYRSARSS
jgi:peptide-methionine (S)-S-oxide reductase